MTRRPKIPDTTGNILVTAIRILDTANQALPGKDAACRVEDVAEWRILHVELRILRVEWRSVRVVTGLSS